MPAKLSAMPAMEAGQLIKNLGKFIADMARSYALCVVAEHQPIIPSRMGSGIHESDTHAHFPFLSTPTVKLRGDNPP